MITGPSRCLFCVAVAVLCLCVAFSFNLFGQWPGGPNPQLASKPWMDKNLSPDERANLVIKEMTFDEKFQLVHGAGLPGLTQTVPEIVRSNGGGGFVPGIPRLGLPDLNMDDSACGVGGSARKGRYSTPLPSDLALASSWDIKLAREYGALIGRELGDLGFNVSLGGGVDITREARNGRNFEYMGEDPILAGNMVAEYINAVQAQGIIGDIKHYAVNDSETGRYFSNSVVDRRALRETDLLAFEIGVKKGRPGMVMCSYNLINGVYACENDYTLNQVLKKEWGFQGWVISDWLGTHSTVKAALAGLDQEQPAFTFFGAALKKAVDSGEVPMSRLNDMVHRIVRTEFAMGIVDKPRQMQVPDVNAGMETAYKVAAQSAVLLKNEGALLPLAASKVRSIIVIGGHADKGVLSGAGSAQVDPPGGNAVPQPQSAVFDINAILSTPVWHPSAPLGSIRLRAPDARVGFDAGDDAARAAALARQSDVAIVFATQFTHEGNDVPSLALPDGQDKLIETVAQANPRTIVVLETGGPVAMPWIARVPAVLEAWYPGIRGGEAITSILFGDVNPSGKLAVTFPVSDADLPHPRQAIPASGVPGPLDGIIQPKPPFDVKYDEALKVGYKWFDAEKKASLFPFGFGLSYTTFTYSELQVQPGKLMSVKFRVKNTGQRAGAEVAQVYLQFPETAGEPPKRLVGWSKVQLQPGESREVTIYVEPLYLSIFDAESNGWKVVPGTYKVAAGGSSAALSLQASVNLPLQANVTLQ